MDQGGFEGTAAGLAGTGACDDAISPAGSGLAWFFFFFFSSSSSFNLAL
jgi:hypothetical protein